MTDFDDGILNDYLDGELDPADAEAFETALAGDSDLERRVAALSETMATMRELPSEAIAPEAVWTGIRGRIAGDPQVIPLSRGTSHRRTLRVSWSQLAAAAVVLVALTGSLTWFFAQGASVPAQDLATSGDPNTTASEAGTIDFASSALVDEYEATTAELEEILAQGAGVLSDETLEIVRESLTTIDEAIAEARMALENDPGSPMLSRILTNNMKKKLELLTETAAAIQAIA